VKTTSEEDKENSDPNSKGDKRKRAKPSAIKRRQNYMKQKDQRRKQWQETQIQMGLEPEP
jgi:hypothetical protein